MRQLLHPGQLRAAAGEVVSQPRQLTDTSRAGPVILQPTVPRQLNELLAGVPLQHERIRHGGDGPVLGPFAPSALHIRQGPGADPGHSSELLERQARCATMTAQHLAETQLSGDGTPLPAGRHSTRRNRADSLPRPAAAVAG
jgi:hypothetical protein